MSRYPRCAVWRRGILALMLALTGCSGDGRSQVPGTSPPAGEAQAKSTEPPATADAVAISNPVEAPQIKLRDVDGDGFRASVAAHAGQVVLVDMWATWCAPCREKFPHVVDLHRQHGRAGLAVISLSVDERDAREEVLRFLTEQRAEFENLLGTYGVGTEAIDAFEYGGDVPFYKLYDRRGELRYEFSGDPRDGIESIENLDQRVTELLAAPG